MYPFITPILLKGWEYLMAVLGCTKFQEMLISDLNYQQRLTVKSVSYLDS